MTAAGIDAGLPPAVLEAAAARPGGQDLGRHRAWLLQRGGRFAEVMRRVEREPLPPEALAELWMWLVHLVLNDGFRAATTGASYARTVSRFLRWADGAGVDFHEATLPDFDRWQRWLAVECRNRETWRAQQVSAVRSFYDWRRARGLSQVNNAADLRAPLIRPKPARKYTDEQLAALFRAIATASDSAAVRDKAIILLLLTTGARREELATLTLPQLELQRRVGVVRFHGKGSKEREVSFEGPVVQALHDWLELRETLPVHDPEAVFISLRGPRPGNAMAMRTFETMLARYARQAKLRTWGIHRFRVTFATQLYDDGKGIEEIRALMGHESIETTRRYLAVSERSRRTRLSASRQHRVLGTPHAGTPMWTRLLTGGGNG